MEVRQGVVLRQGEVVCLREVEQPVAALEAVGHLGEPPVVAVLQGSLRVGEAGQQAVESPREAVLPGFGDPGLRLEYWDHSLLVLLDSVSAIKEQLARCLVRGSRKQSWSLRLVL